MFGDIVSSLNSLENCAVSIEKIVSSCFANGSIVRKHGRFVDFVYKQTSTVQWPKGELYSNIEKASKMVKEIVSQFIPFRKKLGMMLKPIVDQLDARKDPRTTTPDNQAFIRVCYDIDGMCDAIDNAVSDTARDHNDQIDVAEIDAKTGERIIGNHEM